MEDPKIERNGRLQEWNEMEDNLSYFHINFMLDLVRGIYRKIYSIIRMSGSDKCRNILTEAFNFDIYYTRIICRQIAALSLSCIAQTLCVRVINFSNFGVKLNFRVCHQWTFVY